MAFGVKYVPLSPGGYCPPTRAPAAAAPPNPKPTLPVLDTTYDDTDVFPLEITESTRRSLEEFMMELEKTPEGRAKLEELLSPISTSYDLSVPALSPEDNQFDFFDSFSTDNASETSMESFDFDMSMLGDIPEDIGGLTSWNFNEPMVYNQEAPETGECLQVIDAIIAAQDLIDEALRAKMDKQLDEFVNCSADLINPILDLDVEMASPPSESSSEPSS